MIAFDEAPAGEYESHWVALSSDDVVLLSVKKRLKLIICRVVFALVVLLLFLCK